MLMNRGKLRRMVLAMIREHAPSVAAGDGLRVRPTGKTFVVSLPAETIARLNALPAPTVPSSSGAGAHMGPPPPIAPPPIPRLGP